MSALFDGTPAPGWPILHAHVGYPEGAAVAAVARARGIPMILTEHATYLDRLFADPEIRAAYLEGARTASRIIAVSRFLADRIVAEFPDLAARIVVIPNTVDVDSFRPVGPADRRPDELLWVGYRREYKGVPTMLAALKIVRRVRPNATLRMIGRSTTDAEEEGWHRLAGELDVSESVSFEPPSDDRVGIAQAMERAAVFVHASRLEMQGIVAVEGLSAGLPVVAVDSGGVTETLGPRPEEFGALVPRQDPELLAAAIIETLGRRDQFDPHVLRAHVVERYGAPAVAERIADLYHEVLDSTRRGMSSAASGGLVAHPGRPAKRRPGDRPVVLVGFERQALDRALATYPAKSLGPVAIATSGVAVAGFPDASLLPSAISRELATLLDLRGRARGPGVTGLIGAPFRWLTRTVMRRRLVRRVLPALTSAVAAASGVAVRRGAETPVTIVCLGGIDVIAAFPLAATGAVVIAPGGSRWLADLREG